MALTAGRRRQDLDNVSAGLRGGRFPRGGGGSAWLSPSSLPSPPPRCLSVRRAGGFIFFFFRGEQPARAFVNGRFGSEEAAPRPGPAAAPRAALRGAPPRSVGVGSLLIEMINLIEAARVARLVLLAYSPPPTDPVKCSLWFIGCALAWPQRGFFSVYLGVSRPAGSLRGQGLLPAVALPVPARPPPPLPPPPGAGLLRRWSHAGNGSGSQEAEASTCACGNGSA